MALYRQFIRAHLTVEILDQGQARALKMPVLRHSHRGFIANQIGCLGELVVELWLTKYHVPCAFLYYRSHDIEIRGKKTEIKTKDRSVPPKETFECSTPTYNNGVQNPEWYVFISLERHSDGYDKEDIHRFHTAWILGYATREDMATLAQIRKAGDKEPNGVVFFTDCMNIFIHQLRPISEIVHDRTTT